MAYLYKITDKGRYYLKLLKDHTRDEAQRLADLKFPDAELYQANT